MRKAKLTVLSLLALGAMSLASCTGAQGEKGDKGDQGEQGIQGEPGEPGEPGEDGSFWYSGEGAPSSDLGKEGDMYLNTSNGDVYQKEDYLNILDKHDNVVSVVAGHLHVNSEVMRNGVYHITSPTLLSTPPVYKIITITTTKGFSPMIYTELKEVEMPEK